MRGKSTPRATLPAAPAARSRRAPGARGFRAAIGFVAFLLAASRPVRAADCTINLGRFFSARSVGAFASESGEPSLCLTLPSLFPGSRPEPDPEEFRLDISPSLQENFSDGLPARPSSNLLKNAAVTTGALLMVPIVGALSWWRYEDEPFHINHEGWFGESTYAGGADKASHFFVSYMGSRVLTNVYESLGNEPATSRWLALGVTAVSGVMIEVGDGTAHYGYSWEDIAMDMAGGLTGIGIEAAGIGDLVGFRYGYVGAPVPASAETETEGPQATDYSREIITADLKLAGLLRRMHKRPGPARYLLFSMTYGSKGYRYSQPDYRQRQIGFELGVNFPEVLQSVGVPEQKWWGKALYFVFNYFRMPFTSLGMRYDMNHKKWHGPNAGKEYDPGP